MQFIRWFREIGINDTALVGGKNASLGELYQELTSQGIQVPNGFAITTDAYRYFIAHNRIAEQIERALKSLDTQNMTELRNAGEEIRSSILRSSIPKNLQQAISEAYASLSGSDPEVLRVAVRSSATAEDLEGASFAGQQETFLNISGEKPLLDACLRCFASLFTDRAISYRKDKGFEHLEIALSVGVQRMVRSDLAASGVMFTIDTESGFRNVVLINASYGLGENIVKGVVVPDEYYVFKPTLVGSKRPIIQKILGSKETKLIYQSLGFVAKDSHGRPCPDESELRSVQNVKVSEADRARFAVSDDDILTLSHWACLIEQHYSRKLGRDTPMDIEWGKDGLTQELFILQARPETVHAQKPQNILQRYRLLEKSEVLVSGRRVGEKIGCGPVCVIEGASDLHKLKQGEILVTDQTDPDWEPVMKGAAAIITNRGGRTCHAAIVARELGIPAIVGAVSATSILKTGELATVSCAEGEVGYVYEGLLNYEVEQTDLAQLSRPQTKVMMIVGNPDEALRLSFIPNDGVGLVREEFIFSSRIKIHPMALVNYPHLKDPEALAKIDELTKGYEDKTQFLVDQLAQGVGMIAAAFFPNEVIVRFSDFKSNEYANLIGGREFEPIEENPMLGFRGASRYYDPRFRAAFALECEAIKKVRSQMGLHNVKVMIPFCRTIKEAQSVLNELSINGLKQADNGLEVYVMCEIPSNVILANEFAELFDGFSIGSNDLTQLVLGVDRDSDILAPIFDERNDAVKAMIRSVVAAAKAKKRKIGICGQAPSDYPEFCEFLVSLGIDSIALNPDVVIETMLVIKKYEDKMENRND